MSDWRNAAGIAEDTDLVGNTAREVKAQSGGKTKGNHWALHDGEERERTAAFLDQLRPRKLLLDRGHRLGRHFIERNLHLIGANRNREQSGHEDGGRKEPEHG